MKNSLSSIRQKCFSLEKYSQSLENQIESLKSEIEKKEQILAKTNKELTQLHNQYKQSLTKIEELDQKQTVESKTSSTNNISNSKINNIYSHINNTEYGGEENYENRINNYSLFRKHHNQRREKKIADYDQKLKCYKKEIKKWRDFAMVIFDLASDGLEIYPDFPKNHYSCQRSITIDLVEQLKKRKADDSQIERKYQSLQKRYNELYIYLEKIKRKCNVLSERNNTEFVDYDHREGEISRIEEFVKEDHYYIEPSSLRRPKRTPRRLFEEKEEFEEKRSKEIQLINKSKADIVGINSFSSEGSHKAHGSATKTPRTLATSPTPQRKYSNLSDSLSDEFNGISEPNRKEVSSNDSH